MGKWELKSFDLGYALVCSECGKKVALKDFIFADRDYNTCPGCDAELELNIDEDEIHNLIKGED